MFPDGADLPRTVRRRWPFPEKPVNETRRAEAPGTLRAVRGVIDQVQVHGPGGVHKEAVDLPSCVFTSKQVIPEACLIPH